MRGYESDIVNELKERRNERRKERKIPNKEMNTKTGIDKIHTNKNKKKKEGDFCVVREGIAARGIGERMERRRRRRRVKKRGKEGG